jgi:hypothetical protein
VKFCDGVPWTTAGFKPLSATVAWVSPPKPLPPRDLQLSCEGSPAMEGKLVLDPSTPLDSVGRTYLFGRAQQDQQKPITIELDRSVAGPIILRIGRVWVLGILEVKLDGKPILRQEFPAGPGKGPWAKSEFDTRWNIWGADYDQDLSIEIPAGKHALELYNAGKDGITIDRIALPLYLTNIRPNVRCIGLIGNRLALLWIQNPEHNLAAVMDRRQVLPAEGVRVTVQGIPAGECAVEWWDTENGTISRTTRERATAQGLTLDLLSLATDVAFKIRW